MRHHFSSQLQRMSVVTSIAYKGGKTKVACLVKGSPEAMKSLSKQDGIPENYNKMYRKLAEKGMRVLALAYKFLSGI